MHKMRCTCGPNYLRALLRPTLKYGDSIAQLRLSRIVFNHDVNQLSSRLLRSWHNQDDTAPTEKQPFKRGFRPNRSQNNAQGVREPLSTAEFQDDTRFRRPRPHRNAQGFGKSVSSSQRQDDTTHTQEPHSAQTRGFRRHRPRPKDQVIGHLSSANTARPRHVKSEFQSADAKNTLVEVSSQSLDTILADSRSDFGISRTRDASAVSQGERANSKKPRNPFAKRAIRRALMFGDPPGSTSSPTSAPGHNTLRVQKARPEAASPAVDREAPEYNWKTQKAALQTKFPDGWKPRRRLSPDAIDGIRTLHAQSPSIYTTKVLSESFDVSPEDIRRILRSKWTPNAKEKEERSERWIRRGQVVWQAKKAQGFKVPVKWRGGAQKMVDAQDAVDEDAFAIDDLLEPASASGDDSEPVVNDKFV